MTVDKVALITAGGSGMGADAARDYAETLVRQAVAKLDRFGPSANLLRDAARFALRRQS